MNQNGLRFALISLALNSTGLRGAPPVHTAGAEVPQKGARQKLEMKIALPVTVQSAAESTSKPSVEYDENIKKR